MLEVLEGYILSFLNWVLSVGGIRRATVDCPNESRAFYTLAPWLRLLTIAITMGALDKLRSTRRNYERALMLLLLLSDRGFFHRISDFGFGFIAPRWVNIRSHRQKRWRWRWSDDDVSRWQSSALHPSSHIADLDRLRDLSEQNIILLGVGSPVSSVDSSQFLGIPLRIWLEGVLVMPARTFQIFP